MTRVQRGLARAIPAAAILLAAAHASPATDLAAQALGAIRSYYYDPAAIDLNAIRARLDTLLRAACAPNPAACPADRAYPALQAVIHDLPDGQSSFRPRPVTERLRVEQAGQAAADRALDLGIDYQGDLIYRVLEGGPADRAGLRPGDTVTGITVNGRVVAPQDARFTTAQAVAVKAVRGNRAFTATVVPAPGVRTALLLPDARLVAAPAGKVAVLRVPSFRAAGTAARAHQLAASLIAQGARGLVLDLRWNGGGYLEEALLTAALFTDGELLSLKARTGTSTYTYAGGTLEARGTAGPPRRVTLAAPTTWPGGVVVLTNHATATAPEVLAAVLRRRDRARVAGEPTAGLAALAVVPVLLADGSELRLAAVRNLFPDGSAVPDLVQPDVPAADDPAALRDGRDPALDAAVAALSAP